MGGVAVSAAICLFFIVGLELLRTDGSWVVGAGQRKTVWRVVFLGTTVLGSVGEVSLVWQLVDLFTALMALPNLAALLVLSPQIMDSLNTYLKTQTPFR